MKNVLKLELLNFFLLFVLVFDFHDDFTMKNYTLVLQHYLTLLVNNITPAFHEITPWFSSLIYRINLRGQ